MKTILRITMILLVAAAVAGAFSLAVNNNLITTGSFAGGQPPALTGSDDQTTTQPMTRPEGGDHEGGSIAGRLAGDLEILLKLTGITVVVLLLQKGLSLLGRSKLKLAQR
jgi:hypothetical protein